MTYKICTHDGTFHADDVFACAALTILQPASEITRSRNPEDWAKADILVDVGGVYDANTGRFDHHMRGGAGVREDCGVPYASFGLVWRIFGQEICSEVRRLDLTQKRTVARLVDERLVQGIDAADCGALRGHRFLRNSETRVEVMSLSGVIAAFNSEPLTARFLMAMEFAERFLRNFIRSVVSEIQAEDVVRRAYTGGPILVLEEYVPWFAPVQDMPRVLFVVFKTLTGQWNVQCASRHGEDHEPRKYLPKKWAGASAEELASLTGVEDAVFCHPAGFICGAKSADGAMRLASLALM